MSQIVANGVSLGALYGLLALSFWVIFAVTRTFHLAHILVLNFAAYTVYTVFVLLGWPLWTAISAAAAVAILTAVAVETWIYQPIRRRGGEGLVIFVASTAVLLIGQAALALLFQESSRGVIRDVPPPVLRAAGMVVSRFDALNIIAAVLGAIVIWALMQRSSLGQSMRAVQENPQLARYFGFNVARIYRLSFALGSLVLVAPATLLAMRNGVNPDLGFTPVLIAIIAVIAGGTESQFGAMAAGFLLGVLQNISLVWLAAEWQTVVTFSALFVILLIRPTGLRAAVAVRTTR